MSERDTYSIETLSYSSMRLVRLGDREVAMLFSPLEPGGSYQLYPHCGTFRSLTFEGLPAPLRPEFMSFPSLEAVYAFLGIKPEADEAQELPIAV